MPKQIPTINRPERIDLNCGGYVSVRRLLASARDECLRSSKFSEGDAGSQAIALQLMLRYGIVACSLPDPVSPGEHIEIERAREPGLGKIATPKIYDALFESAETEEIEKITEAVTGTRSEESGSDGSGPDDPDEGDLSD